MSTILSGYLVKEGGKGHNVKNTKKRWFVLRDGFLDYYEENPVIYKGKDVNNLKGRIFLCGCAVEDTKKPLSVSLQSVKEYILKAQTQEEIECWKNALSFAIAKADSDFQDSRPFTGWLYKKGGRGHKFSNWQRRWFKLQGSLLSYYTEEVKRKNNVKNLKGTIDVSTLTEINPTVDTSKQHCFSIVQNNEREFLFAASSAEEKQAWYDMLLERRETLAYQYGLGDLHTAEQVDHTGLPLLKIGKSFKKVCICITNTNIRFYKSERILDDEDSWDYFNGLIYSISLVGTTLQITNVDGAQILVISDMQSNKFLLKDKSDVIMNIYEVIRRNTRELVSRIVDNGSSIQFNCISNTQDDLYRGYTVIRLSRDMASFRFFQSNEYFEIGIADVAEVTAGSGSLNLQFSALEGPTILSFTESALSLIDTINQLRGVDDSVKIRGKSFAIYNTNNNLEDSFEDDMNNKKRRKDISLADFDLLKVIGRGAFGKVLLVRMISNGKIFAMKSILKKSLVNHKKEIEHTLAERAVMMRLDHPFLMKLYYTFQTPDKLLYVMDYVNGGELFFHLENETCFSIERSRFYIAELSSALQYLHNNGIIYRDIKTENILLDRDGHIVLTDFGLSKELDRDDRTGTLCGTPVYLPPEMLLKQEYNKSVDFWSMGILLFEMLTGDVPFYHDNIQKMFRMIVKDEIPFPSHIREHRDIVDLISRLLDKKPENRMQTFEEFQSHPFFASIDWNMLINKQIPPPFVPNVGDHTDARNVAEEILQEEVEFDIAEENLTKEEEKLFKDIEFDFIDE
eukprot:TRINITY_DN4848_c0_g1_i1.p1 TRINITY_DN4848_c0_g1~~TRINITY_DN4848_c0_g1_i1.p1  ORF type:complete len:795 (+),score=169.87 TRINITY_DN4848_c0_g1_i1:16-2400(+)